MVTIDSEQPQREQAIDILFITFTPQHAVDFCLDFFLHLLHDVEVCIYAHALEIDHDTGNGEESRCSETSLKMCLRNLTSPLKRSIESETRFNALHISLVVSNTQSADTDVDAKLLKDSIAQFIQIHRLTVSPPTD